jgi:hypothetical protein
MMASAVFAEQIEQRMASANKIQQIQSVSSFAGYLLDGRLREATGQETQGFEGKTQGFDPKTQGLPDKRQGLSDKDRGSPIAKTGVPLSQRQGFRDRRPAHPRQAYRTTGAGREKP